MANIQELMNENKLLNDKNKWVKLQAYKNLGPLIYEIKEIE